MSPSSLLGCPARFAGIMGLALASLSPNPALAAPDPSVISSELVARLASELEESHLAVRSLERLAESEKLNAASTRRWSDPELQVGGAVYRYDFMAAEQGDVFYGVTQKLPIMGKERAARTLAETQADAARTRKGAREAELRRDLAVALLDAAARRVVMERVADDVRWLATQAAIAESRVAAGSESPAMSLRLRNELDRRAVERTNHAALHEDALVAVRRLLGRNQPGPDEPYALPAIGPAVTLTPALLRRAEAMEPNVRRSDADVRVARDAIKVTRRSARPDVSLGVQAWHESRTASAAQGFFTLGVSLPWLNRQNYRREVQRDERRLAAAEDQLADARVQVQRDLHALVTRTEVARRDALLQRDVILPRTRQMESTMAAQWTSGRAELRDLLDLRRQRAEAEIAEANAIAAYWSALAEIVVCCGLHTFEAAWSTDAE